MALMAALARRGGDHRAAFTWIRKAAQHGNIQAMFEMGSQLSAGPFRGSMRDAIAWLPKAGRRGHCEALCSLACQLPEERDSLIESAALLGHAGAMLGLARAKFAAKDYAKGWEWLERAAHVGHPEAWEMASGWGGA